MQHPHEVDMVLAVLDTQEIMVYERDLRRPLVADGEAGQTVAPQLTVVTHTSARSGVAVPVKDVHAASVVPSETAAHETTAVRASSSNGP